MFLTAATRIDTTYIITSTMLFLGMSVGGWLVLKPTDLMILFQLNPDEDNWYQFLVQIVGQLILAIVLIPIVISLTRWLYF